MWNLKPEERLREWRAFRSDCNNKTLDLMLADVSKLWSYAPYVTHYLSPDLLEEWPDPWMLVHENYYCDLAKALGMFYTIYLTDHYQKTVDSLEIRIYKNRDTHDTVNTVWVNRGKYILNLIFDTVVNKNLVDENFVLKYKYNINDLSLDLK
jgi:hypothetical protein